MDTFQFDWKRADNETYNLYMDNKIGWEDYCNFAKFLDNTWFIDMNEE
jgi:hypothetical protein